MEDMSIYDIVIDSIKKITIKIPIILSSGEKGFKIVPIPVQSRRIVFHGCKCETCHGSLYEDRIR